MPTPDDAPQRPGAHGGPLVRTARGHVELSVFETGVPPHFRLYFLDATGKHAPPPPADAVVLETVRPDGARQVFGFRAERDYLESTSDIPAVNPDHNTATGKESRARSRRSSDTQSGALR